MSLEDLYARYLSLSPETREANIDAIWSDFAAIDQEANLPWLTEALRDADRRWFVVDGLVRSEHVHEDLFDPLMDSVMSIHDAGHVGYFVQPCIKGFGRRRVMTELLDLFRHGSDDDRVSASEAMYKVGSLIPGEFGEPPRPIDEIRDLRIEEARLYVRRYGRTQSVRLQQQIVGYLTDLTGRPMPVDVRVGAYLTIIRACLHADPWIRQRGRRWFRSRRRHR